MLKRILISILVISFLSSFACAVEINFLKEKYMSGDSVQAEISFENLSLVAPLSYSKIKLYDGDIKIPVGLNLYKLKDKYFIYFELPILDAKDYKFALEDVVYPEKGVLVKNTFYKNLSVVEGRGISVNPGLIYLNIEPWENPKAGIEIKNKASADVLISFESGSEYIVFDKSDYLLKQGKNYFLSMILDMRAYSGNEFSSSVVVKYMNSSYTIPVIVNKLSNEVITNEGGEVVESSEKADLRFVEDANKIERALKKDDRLEGALSFKNFGNKTIEGFSFVLTNDLKNIIRLDYKGDYILSGGEEESVYVYINEEKNLAKNYSGELVIKTEDTETKLPVNIYYKPLEINEIKNETEKSNYTLINYSEFNKPKLPKKNRSKTWIFGVIILFLMIFLYIIYYFYEKSKPKKKKFESLLTSS